MGTRPLFAIGFVCAVVIACGGSTSGGGGPGDGGGGGGNDGGSDGATLPDGAPVPDYGACSGDGSCVLKAASCCAGTWCTQPTIGDFVAIARDKASAYDASRCQGLGCAACIVDPSRIANFQAVCRAGRCTAIDVRTDPISGCATGADCAVRAASCCDCGARTFVAIRADQVSAYSGMVCQPNQGCPACASQPGYLAACDGSTHHCKLVPMPDSGVADGG